MNRLLRILLNAAKWTSLLLCIGAAMAWAWSYYSGWSIETRTAESNLRGNRIKFLRVESRPGTIGLIVLSKPPYKGRLTGESGEIPVYYDKRFSLVPRFVARKWDHPTPEPHGFSWSTQPVSSNTGIYDRSNLIVPWWSVVVLTAIMPATARLLRKKRREGNCCRVCGYDLRTTPQRCPECGTEPFVATSNASI